MIFFFPPSSTFSSRPFCTSSKRCGVGPWGPSGARCGTGVTVAGPLGPGSCLPAGGSCCCSGSWRRPGPGPGPGPGEGCGAMPCWEGTGPLSGEGPLSPGGRRLNLSLFSSGTAESLGRGPGDSCLPPGGGTCWNCGLSDFFSGGGRVSSPAEAEASRAAPWEAAGWRHPWRRRRGCLRGRRRLRLGRRRPGLFFLPLLLLLLLLFLLGQRLLAWAAWISPRRSATTTPVAVPRATASRAPRLP